MYNVPYRVPNIHGIVVVFVAHYFVSTFDHFLLNFVRQRSTLIITQRLCDPMFHCFNINCYQRFRTERGLRSHLWRSSLCQEYMSRAWIDVSVETVSTSRLVGYGVESTRLDFDMNTNVPLYAP